MIDLNKLSFSDLTEATLMSKKREQFNAARADMNSLHERLAFLTEDELMQLVGGSSADAPAECKPRSAVDEWWAARTQNKYRFD